MEPTKIVMYWSYIDNEFVKAKIDGVEADIQYALRITNMFTDDEAECISYEDNDTHTIAKMVYLVRWRAEALDYLRRKEEARIKMIFNASTIYIKSKDFEYLRGLDNKVFEGFFLRACVEDTALRIVPRKNSHTLTDVPRIKRILAVSTVGITMKNAERLLEQDPEIFDGLNIEFTK